MDDQKVKKKQRKEQVRKAVRKIANTEAGVVFFQWLSERCHFQYSTLSGDPESHEVNSLVTIGREYERMLYLGIRNAFTDEQKFKIEVKQYNTKDKEEDSNA